MNAVPALQEITPVAPVAAPKAKVVKAKVNAPKAKAPTAKLVEVNEVAFKASLAKRLAPVAGATATYSYAQHMAIQWALKRNGKATQAAVQAWFVKQFPHLATGRPVDWAFFQNNAKCVKLV